MKNLFDSNLHLVQRLGQTHKSKSNQSRLNTTVSSLSKPSQAELTNRSSSNVSVLRRTSLKHKYCVICSNIVFRQFEDGRSQWYCSQCHSSLSDSLVSAFNRDRKKPSEPRSRFFCNQSRFIKVIQFQDGDTGYQEYVVFPGQTVVFSLLDETRVQVKSSEHMTNLDADTVLAEALPLAVLEEVPDPRPAA